MAWCGHDPHAFRDLRLLVDPYCPFDIADLVLMDVDLGLLEHVIVAYVVLVGMGKDDDVHILREHLSDLLQRGLDGGSHETPAGVHHDVVAVIGPDEGGGGPGFVRDHGTVFVAFQVPEYENIDGVHAFRIFKRV